MSSLPPLSPVTKGVERHPKRAERRPRPEALAHSERCAALLKPKAWHDTPHAWHAWTLWQLCDGDAWSPGECAGEASDTGEASGSTTRSVALLRQRSPPKGITGL